jgi:hypothetical protein
MVEPWSDYLVTVYEIERGRKDKRTFLKGGGGGVSLCHQMHMPVI